MSASDDARKAISEVVVVLPCEVDSMLDTDEVRHTFGHLPIVLHVCDELDRLRAENAVALSILRTFAYPFNPDDPDSGWSFGGYTDKTENVAFLARLEADRG